MKGIGLLDTDTVFTEKKTRTRVTGRFKKVGGILQNLSDMKMEGYEIHMGSTTLGEQTAAFTEITSFAGEEKGAAKADGVCHGNVYGTYVHGIFEKEEVVKAIVTAIGEAKGLDMTQIAGVDFAKFKEIQYNIEKRSFELITEELGERTFPEEQEPIIKRCIHTSADFDYADNLCFSEGVVEKAKEAIRNGACIVTDTQMAKSGINKKKLAAYGGEVFCFMSDEDVAETAKKNGTTRATACMDKAAAMNRPLIFAIGNAPTALIRLYELIEEKKLKPELVIGVPVGFVNVVQSKELIMQADVPYIVARGRKGGSNIAACICNALLYNM